MTQSQSRIAFMLALAPGTFAVTVFCGELGPPSWSGVAWADSSQFACLIATLVFMAAWWAIWRPPLARQSRAVATTVAMAVLIIGQILVWQPIVHSTECAHDTTMLMAQSLGDLGLWCLGFALTWWGGRRWRELRRRRQWPSDSTAIKGTLMTPGIVRLALGFSLIPLLPALFFIVVLLLDDFFSLHDQLAFTIGYAVCGIVAISIWLLAWRRAVCWTPRRTWMTALLVAAVFASAFSPFVPDIHDIVDTVIKVWPTLMLAVWFAGTAWVWRLQPGECSPDQLELTPANALQKTLSTSSALSVPCGKCSYDLRGLREARCPECGWTTTVDVLVRRGMVACLSLED